MVTAYDSGQKIVERIHGRASPSDFVLALQHNEPIFICDCKGKPSPEELRLLCILYDT